MGFALSYIKVFALRCVTYVCAVRIYQGQRMVLGKSSDGPLLREMQVILQFLCIKLSYFLH